MPRGCDRGSGRRRRRLLLRTSLRKRESRSHSKRQTNQQRSSYSEGAVIMSEHDTCGQAGGGLIGAAKRNPEALLVLAAGAALFLRGRNGQASPSRSYGAQTAPSRSYYDDEASRQPTSSRASGALSRVADSASGLAEGAKDYASDVTERISSTAGSYASTVSKFADDARQTVTSQASRFADRAQSPLPPCLPRRPPEQPLALAGLSGP